MLFDDDDETVVSALFQVGDQVSTSPGGLAAATATIAAVAAAAAV